MDVEFVLVVLEIGLLIFLFYVVALSHPSTIDEDGVGGALSGLGG